MSKKYLIVDVLEEGSKKSIPIHINRDSIQFTKIREVVAPPDSKLVGSKGTVKWLVDIHIISPFVPFKVFDHENEAREWQKKEITEYQENI